MNLWTYEQTNTRMNEWIDKQTQIKHEGMNPQTNEQTKMKEWL